MPQNDIADVAHRWRVKLRTNPHEIPGIGAFDGFRVILQTGKQQSFQSLIEAGGGIVINVT